MINYKHLRYFWAVANEGSVTAASERLHVTPQTISGQLGALEEELGKPLCQRSGRHLELTDTGQLAKHYAEEIFSLGSELEERIRQPRPDQGVLFKVGVVDAVPKTIAYRVLAPALEVPGPVRLQCREGSLETLLGDLALHRIDLVISDAPIPSGMHVRGFSHRLGDCGVSLLAHPRLVARMQGGFPHCLAGQPLLLSGRTPALKSQLMQWFAGQGIYPHLVGEFDDSALMKEFGRAGTGVFIAPTPLEDEVEKQLGVTTLGRVEAVREQFYAISVERHISHPAVALVTQAAREWLF